MKIIFVWKDGTETPAKYSVSGSFSDAGLAASEELSDLIELEPNPHSYSNLKEVRIIL
jgi:hypothetical protein